ncbi:dihydrodipicolinate synthase family protein [Acidisphaera sp. L21]|uniref:dihydrodipicolinate synthase family protein n=1 Tax=Acidisphaera sp. L21 TaxID=1641851 RepID=UPI00131C2295|nr:dihydrodipicolinate synthase family protein [Acidisphaera sp. L21]
MIPSHTRPFRGIYTATLVPLDDQDRIDTDRLAQHFAAAVATDGIVGVLCNGHAGEVFLLSREERRLVVQTAREVIGNRAIIVSGVLCEESGEAQRHAADAQAAGADALLVFPPFSWALSQETGMVLRHHQAIARAVDMPMMLYQAGVRAGTLAYPAETLEQLVQLPQVVGIKEGSWETAAYDVNRRLVAQAAPHVEMMASGDEHLLPCFAIGSDGSLVSLAVLLPEEIVALDRAIQRGDMATARAMHARIQPLANAIYGTAPGGLATVRLKACMELLGRWPSGHGRQPIGALDAAEMARLRGALVAAGLMGAR